MNIIELLDQIDDAFQEHVDEDTSLEDLRSKVRLLIQEYNNGILDAIREVDNILSR